MPTPPMQPLQPKRPWNSVHNMLPENLLQTALDCGAAKAACITGAQVVYSESFRDICRGNQCGCYGKCWVCPPDIGEIGDLIAQSKTFPRGVLYQTIGTLEDSFDIEGMMSAGQHHAHVSSRIHALLPSLLQKPFLHLGCGGCHLCQVCAKQTGDPCRHPELALHAMEGYGIDVYNTTRSTVLNYINGTNTVTYFGVILFSE